MKINLVNGVGIIISPAISKKMRIQFKEATKEQNELLQDYITDFNITVIKGFPRAESQKIDLMALTPDDRLIGGINAEWVNWGILFIHLLFIKEEFRGYGYGSMLLKEAEKRARSNGCYLSHLDTFDFQGKDFYIANGYSIFGILDNCPKSHQRYYLKKELL